MARRFDRQITAVYGLCYRVGRDVIILCKRCVRFAIRQSAPAVRYLRYRWDRLRVFLRHQLRRLVADMAFPFVKFRNAGGFIREHVDEARANGGGSVRAVFRAIRIGIRANDQTFAHFFNYALPIMSVAFLGTLIVFCLNLNFGLVASMGGESVGLIPNESVYRAAQRQLSQRILYKSEEAVNTVPTYAVVALTDERFNTADQVTDKMIEASGGSIQYAGGLFIDGEFYGATRDSEALKNFLNNRLSQYGTDDPADKVFFVKSVRVVDGLYPDFSLKEYGEIESMLSSNVEGKIVYTAVKGDTPYDIARRNGISVAALEAMNPGISKKLAIGQEVLIQASTSFLQVQVESQVYYEEPIAYATERVSNSAMNLGTTRVIQKGKEGVSAVNATVVKIDGVEVSRTVTEKKTVKDPVPERVYVGTKSLPPTVASAMVSAGGAALGSGSYLWPVGGNGYISCRWLGYRGHYGLDIATYGSPTPILAVDRGVVIMSQTYGSYGKCIQIDHGNGVITLYAHCSALYVSPGQVVERGQQIGLTGRTGRATGVHLHIEFIVNGVKRNPANYL